VWCLLLIAACGERPSATPGSGSGATVAISPSAVASAGGQTTALAPASTTAVALVADAAPRAEDPPRALDMHVDTPWQVKFKGRSVNLSEGHATMAALKAGKYGGIVYPIYIADYLHDDHPTIQDADEIFDTIDKIIARHADVLHSVEKGPTPPGKISAYVSIEGAGAFAADITQIDRFIERGVIFIGPVHAHDSPLSTSATGEKKGKQGLTDIGKKFCERVYANGALVDVSHMSDRGFNDLLPIAEKFGAPIVATHSNARAVTNVPRNLSDEQLRAIAKTGGVAGLNFYAMFVKKGGGGADIDDLVKHALHMIDVAGIDHVGIGSDFDGGTPAKGLDDASKLQDLARALRKAGVSAADVHKIFSENTKRMIRWTAEHRKKKR